MMTFVGKASNLKQSLPVVVSGILTGPKYVFLHFHFALWESYLFSRRDRSYITCPWIRKDSLMNGRGNSWMVREPSFYVHNLTKKKILSFSHC